MKDRRNDFGTIYATDSGRGYLGYPGTKGSHMHVIYGEVLRS